MALPRAPSAGSRDAGRGTSVLLREVTVPGYLDTFPVAVIDVCDVRGRRPLCPGAHRAIERNTDEMPTVR